MQPTHPPLPSPAEAAGSRRRFWPAKAPARAALGRAALVAILILAAGLRFANLEAIGNGNAYYTAAVKSMLQSWHNFFFVAAEPGGSVSVDKPPVGLWIQSLSAYFLGVNGLAVVLPQIIAGLLSVGLVYHLVRRSFGAAAGLLAALALAVTPVVVATDRNNTMDSLLVLALLLAAWAFIKATETRRLRFLLLGAVLVGVGFNIKMLQAFLPLPAFVALYFLGAAESVGRKVGKLALTGALLLAVSLSWAVIVDLTPATRRPYVGSSGDNSVMSLITGYNGLQRLLGTSRSPRAGGRAGGDDRGLPPPPGGPRQPNPGGGANPAPGAGDGAGGLMGTGQPGPWRLFVAPLSKEMSWLLPFGLLSAGLLALRRRPAWPLAGAHPALVLWGGWLAAGIVFFSLAGFFHQYYLSLLAPPLAALVGAGAGALWQLSRERPWPAFGLLLAGAGGTLAFQVYTAQAFTTHAVWLPLAGALFIGGAGLLAAAALRRAPRLAAVAFTAVLLAMLVTPTAWAGLTTARANNQNIPEAYTGDQAGEAARPAGGFGITGGIGPQVNPALLAFLQENTQGMKYLLAAPSAQVGDGYILATGRPVLLMGGFNGSDPVVTADDLARLVAGGDLRYVLIETNRGGPAGAGGVSAWVTAQCTPVASLGSAPTFDRIPGGALYDCGGG